MERRKGLLKLSWRLSSEINLETLSWRGLNRSSPSSRGRRRRRMGRLPRRMRRRRAELWKIFNYHFLEINFLSFIKIVFLYEKVVYFDLQNIYAIFVKRNSKINSCAIILMSFNAKCTSLLFRNSVWRNFYFFHLHFATSRLIMSTLCNWKTTFT